jgi:hypothetical protein
MMAQAYAAKKEVRSSTCHECGVGMRKKVLMMGFLVLVARWRLHRSTFVLDQTPVIGELFFLALSKIVSEMYFAIVM